MDSVWMHCSIENSGFPSERRFEVELPDSGRVVGIAFVEYLRDADSAPIGDGIPSYDQTINGFVQCRVVKKEADCAYIEFPGSEVFHVPAESLEEMRR